LLDHVSRLRLHAKERRAKVDMHQLIPGLRCVRLDPAAQAGDSGIVERKIQASKYGNYLIDRRTDGVEYRKIRLDEMRLTSGGGNLVAGRSALRRSSSH
jgi:hypothetical protein